MASTTETILSPVEPLNVPFGREGLEDVGYMTCMTLVLLSQYARTGRFGGPLSYAPLSVAAHLAGHDLGGMRFVSLRSKHRDKFVLRDGHRVSTSDCFWIIMCQALQPKYKLTLNQLCHIDPHGAILSTDPLSQHFCPAIGQHREGAGWNSLATREFFDNLLHRFYRIVTRFTRRFWLPVGTIFGSPPHRKLFTLVA